MSSVAGLAGVRCVGCGRSGAIACRACLEGVRPAHPVSVAGVEPVGAVWVHEGAARELVLGLKLRGMKAFAAPLVDGLVDLARRTGTAAEVISWPPCAPSDRKRRGFDHAEQLARGVGRELGLPVLPLLRRVGVAADQAGLSGEERRRNLLGVFAARVAITGAVLLVDDVVTSGATLGSCAAALRAAGAPRVEALAACSAFGAPRLDPA